MTLTYNLVGTSEEGFHVLVNPILKGSVLEGEKLHSRTLSELRDRLELISKNVESLREGKYVSSTAFYFPNGESDKSNCVTYTTSYQQIGNFPPYLVTLEKPLGKGLAGKPVFVHLSLKEAELHISRILDLIPNFTEN